MCIVNCMRIICWAAVGTILIEKQVSPTLITMDILNFSVLNAGEFSLICLAHNYVSMN